MFTHILDLNKEVNWTYANYTCAAYPLKYTDTIKQDTGEINQASALALVVYGDSVMHLNLLDGLLEELLKAKWVTFAKKKFRKSIKTKFELI